MAGGTSKRGGNPSVELILGRLIKERRLAMGMTMAKLAEEIGVALQQVQKYENGTNRVYFSRLLDIAAALDVDLTYFADGCGRLRTAEQRTIPRGCVQLVQAYSGIRDTSLRKRALAMVKALAEKR